MSQLSFAIEDRMKSIGWYQILGGIIGVFMVCYTLFYTGELTGIDLLFFLIIVLLLIFNIYCGNLLRKADIRGLKLSTWNQALQILQFGIVAFGFEYYAGIRLAFGFDWGELFRTDIAISATSIHLRYTPDKTSDLSIWINIVPIIIIYWIDKIEQDIEERKKIAEMALESINEQK